MLQAQKKARSYMIEVKDENGKWWNQDSSDNEKLAYIKATHYVPLYGPGQVRIRIIY